jgi:hypothetical protein
MTQPGRYAICIRNEGYPASLEIRKLYRVLDDAETRGAGYLRVVDESGEDYLYPADYFVLVNLPARVRNAVEAAA